MARLNSSGTFVKKEIVASELKKIAERDGVVRPRVVVDEARSEESPIHSLFDWNDATAAEEYRLWQARQLIAKVRVEYNDEQVDAYYHVRAEVVPQEGYFPVDKVMSEEALYNDVLSQALKELLYFRQKYSQLKELGKVFEEVDKL